jgi:hypothetical protein
MIRLLKIVAPLALLSLGACATQFQAKVSRFQQLPVPQGQSFAIVSANPHETGGLEFATYANLVAAKLGQVGYARATSADTANLIVTLDYGVDKGREKVRSYGGFGGYGGYGGYGGFGGYGGYGYGGFGGYGGYGYGGFGHPFYGYGRRSFIGGFYDPFLFDNFNDVQSYTVYSSELQMKIERKGGERVFEGKAQAMSADNDLTTLVPNLIEAMFTGFPGNSGETVKITVAPPGKARR